MCYINTGKCVFFSLTLFGSLVEVTVVLKAWSVETCFIADEIIGMDPADVSPQKAIVNENACYKDEKTFLHICQRQILSSTYWL